MLLMISCNNSNIDKIEVQSTTNQFYNISKAAVVSNAMLISASKKHYDEAEKWLNSSEYMLSAPIISAECFLSLNFAHREAVKVEIEVLNFIKKDFGIFYESHYLRGLELAIDTKSNLEEKLLGRELIRIFIKWGNDNRIWDIIDEIDDSIGINKYWENSPEYKSEAII